MDNPAVLSLLVLAPILLVGGLLAGLRLPAQCAMLIGYVVTALAALLVWRMSLITVLAATKTWSHNSVD